MKHKYDKLKPETHQDVQAVIQEVTQLLKPGETILTIVKQRPMSFVEFNNGVFMFERNPRRKSTPGMEALYPVILEWLVSKGENFLHTNAQQAAFDNAFGENRRGLTKKYFPSSTGQETYYFALAAYIFDSRKRSPGLAA